jgi:2-C-methyl-D-erythritol 2,4-cyclodiphosphate synthase
VKTIIRTGFGIDIHQLTEGRKLILGGVDIPSEKGLKGHSDADVLIHAICDAFLGAMGLGDIGIFFPDTDSKYKDISSLIFLENVKALLDTNGYSISNIDSMLALEKPKIVSYIPEMKKNISDILKIEPDLISIKATTSEKMGFVGRNEGAAAYANVLIMKENNV